MSESSIDWNEILSHLGNMAAGHCRIDEELIDQAGPTPRAEVLSGLLMLWETLEYECEREVDARLEAEHLSSQLADALRLATADQMAAWIAHELHQPLAAISAMAGAARREIERGVLECERILEKFDEIQRQSLHAGTLVGKARGFLCQSGRVSDVLSLNDLVDEVSEFLYFEARRRGVSLLLHLAPNLPGIPADRVQVQQVLVNLVQNALVAVDSEPAVRRCVEVSTAMEEGFVSLRVRDHGPGLSPEAGKQMFDPFYTTREGGLGMGLSICRSIADFHDGALTGENHPDGGAVFLLRLPLAG